MSSYCLDVAQLALLMIISVRVYGADVRRIACTVERWRLLQRRLDKLAVADGRNGEGIDIAAQLVADEVKRRLWLIRSGSDHVA